VNLEALLGASTFISERLGVRVPSRYYQAWLASTNRKVS
jgi:hypothetical protein